VSTLCVTVIGAEGFVGSAFVRRLRAAHGVELREVTRRNYAEFAGKESDLVVDAACNSKKYLSERDPLQDFEQSVAHRLRTLLDFPARFQLHVSSVDVYSQLDSSEATAEAVPVDPGRTSRYGVNKLLAEMLVERYADRWLILRLAGMVGSGLRKNPVYDILHGTPIYIHPDSQYQFMNSDDVARIALALAEKGIGGEIFNVCGDGLISPREIARLAGHELVLSSESRSSQPRIVNINIDKIRRLMAIPQTQASVASFVRAWQQG